MAAAPAILLALDPGVGETGWAIFSGWTPVATGVIAPARAAAQYRDGKGSAGAAVRIAALLGSLEELRDAYGPDAAALCEPSGLRWSAPALTLLGSELTRWAAAARLPVASYSAGEVRRAVAGHPRASRQALAFAVMDALGLIGVHKTTHEWEAIAVGAYHLLAQSRRDG